MALPSGIQAGLSGLEAQTEDTRQSQQTGLRDFLLGVSKAVGVGVDQLVQNKMFLNTLTKKQKMEEEGKFKEIALKGWADGNLIDDPSSPITPQDIQSGSFIQKLKPKPAEKKPATMDQVKAQMAILATSSPEVFKQLTAGLNDEGKRLLGLVPGTPLVQIGGPTSALTPGVKTELQKAIREGQSQIANLKSIQDAFKPEFLQIKGTLKSAGQQALDKAGVPVNTKFLEENTKFKSQAKQFFNQYRKEITGVAAGEKELQSILAAVPDTDKDSPSQFKAKLETTIKLREAMVKRDQLLLQQGIPLTPENRAKIPLDSPELQQDTPGGMLIDYSETPTEDLLKELLGGE